MAKRSRVRPVLDCSGEVNRTQQQFQAECDVNVIAARLSAGQPVSVRSDMGRFGDFSEAPDFYEAQNLVIRARDQFMSLPAKVRARFDNDPGKLLAFVADRKNLEEAHDLGLLHGEAAKAVELSRAKALADAAAKAQS